MVSFFNAISKTCTPLLLYIHMKTLYESIIQSRFGDHKIEESILDADASDRLENDVKAGIKRQKRIQDILKPLEDVIVMYHYNTPGGGNVTRNSYGLTGDMIWYEFESEAKTPQTKKGVEVILNNLKKAYDKAESDVPVIRSSSLHSSCLVFEEFGISIFVGFFSDMGVVIRLCYQLKNKQVGKYVQDMMRKYTEPF